MMLKKYLTEVSFQDGSTEFKSYRNYTKTVDITDVMNGTTSLRITLEEKEIDTESISIEIRGRYDVPVYYRNINGANTNSIEAYLDDENVFIQGDIIEIHYIGLNEAVSDLYSVDYENGVLYLATETNIDLGVDYKFYNTMVKGKKAEQLDEEDYVVDDTSASINNFRADTSYRLVYNVIQPVAEEYTTPILRNIKVNYINTSEEETF